MSEHFTGFNFPCSDTLELNCTDSLIQMSAKLSRMSGIYLLYFLQNGSVTLPTQEIVLKCLTYKATAFLCTTPTLKTKVSQK